MGCKNKSYFKYEKEHWRISKYSIENNLSLETIKNKGFYERIVFEYIFIDRRSNAYVYLRGSKDIV
jgi:hypothetical protein